MGSSTGGVRLIGLPLFSWIGAKLTGISGNPLGPNAQPLHDIQSAATTPSKITRSVSLASHAQNFLSTARLSITNVKLGVQHLWASLQRQFKSFATLSSSSSFKDSFHTAPVQLSAIDSSSERTDSLAEIARGSIRPFGVAAPTTQAHYVHPLLKKMQILLSSLQSQSSLQEIQIQQVLSYIRTFSYKYVELKQALLDLPKNQHVEITQLTELIKKTFQAAEQALEVLFPKNIEFNKNYKNLNGKFKILMQKTLLDLAGFLRASDETLFAELVHNIVLKCFDSSLTHIQPMLEQEENSLAQKLENRLKNSNNQLQFICKINTAENIAALTPELAILYLKELNTILKHAINSYHSALVEIHHSISQAELSEVLAELEQNLFIGLDLARNLYLINPALSLSPEIESSLRQIASDKLSANSTTTAELLNTLNNYTSAFILTKINIALEQHSKKWNALSLNFDIQLRRTIQDFRHEEDLKAILNFCINTTADLNALCNLINTSSSPLLIASCENAFKQIAQYVSELKEFINKVRSKLTEFNSTESSIGLRISDLEEINALSATKSDSADNFPKTLNKKALLSETDQQIDQVLHSLSSNLEIIDKHQSPADLQKFTRNPLEAQNIPNSPKQTITINSLESFNAYYTTLHQIEEYEQILLKISDSLSNPHQLEQFKNHEKQLFENILLIIESCKECRNFREVTLLTRLASPLLSLYQRRHKIFLLMKSTKIEDLLKKIQLILDTNTRETIEAIEDVYISQWEDYKWTDHFSYSEEVQLKKPNYTAKVHNMQEEFMAIKKTFVNLTERLDASQKNNSIAINTLVETINSDTDTTASLPQSSFTQDQDNSTWHTSSSEAAPLNIEKVKASSQILPLLYRIDVRFEELFKAADRFYEMLASSRL